MPLLRVIASFGERYFIRMWLWLPDDLLRRIVQFVADRAPRALATFALLNTQSCALAAARLSLIKPLTKAPFSLTVHEIFSDTLDLARRELSSEHMKTLGSALGSRALAHLTCLYLDQNQIGDMGMRAFADASSGALPSLKQLFLQGNQISDDGFATLMPLLNKDGKLSNLTEFSIGSGITEKGMTEFADILSNGALDHLTVC